ncbi:porin [Trinickia soli]|uniref:Porin n=1 Tax=Trinickia soli TaxID=380675 RepID=A0A2N7VWF5_9BURK|nr:porin [Trinickia soli]PMS21488.1 porin [Trinickia soli]
MQTSTTETQLNKRVLKLSAVALAAGLAAGAAQAQSSVTLYGIVDTGIGYQNNQAPALGATSGGHASTKMINGIWSGSRFGMKGSEDLGGGTKAIFTLEEGFNSATGAMAVSGLAFNRQAFVGLTDARLGTFTAGRQYTAYYTLLSPWSPTTWLTGAFGAHPGDIDSLDTNYRANNSFVYMSPTIGGLTLGGSYSIGGEPGSFNAGSTWSAAAQYKNGPLGIAAGIQRVNNSAEGGGAWGSFSTVSNAGGQPAVSALNNGYQLAQAQQRIAVTGGWQFTPSFDISVSYSNVQYVPGVNSKFASEAVFNTYGAVLHWKATPALDLAGGYSYTKAAKANGVTDGAQYQQIVFSQYYSLSKRTAFYVLEAFTRANGQTLNASGAVINATATVGDGFNGTPSASRNLFAAGAGIVHRF